MKKLLLFYLIAVLMAACTKQEKLYTAEEVKYMMDSLVRNEVNKRLKEQEENFKMRNKVEIRAQVEKMRNKEGSPKTGTEQDPALTAPEKNTNNKDSFRNEADPHGKDALPVKE